MVNILLQELSYDAWGRLRNPDTHEAYASDSVPTPILGRGYTGHRHIAGIGLIDMNARLYDPMLGRFLSPDPHIQSPDCPQNYNRYTYCLNNPLRYTDPTGEDWMQKRIFDKTFYFYDERVKSQNDMEKYYGYNSGLRYIGPNFIDMVVIGGSIYYIEGHADGTFSINGNKQNNEYISDTLVVGSSLYTDINFIWKREKLKNGNWYGFYLGPDNPKLKNDNQKSSYGLPPINEQDYNAYLHDLDYDKKGAEGPESALFDISVIDADKRFVERSMMNSKIKFFEGDYSQAIWSFGSAVFFKAIIFYKSTRRKK